MVKFDLLLIWFFLGGLQWVAGEVRLHLLRCPRLLCALYQEWWRDYRTMDDWSQ